MTQHNVVRWAKEELNLRPHAYQASAAKTNHESGERNSLSVRHFVRLGAPLHQRTTPSLECATVTNTVTSERSARPDTAMRVPAISRRSKFFRRTPITSPLRTHSMSDRPSPWASQRTRVHRPYPTESRPQPSWSGFHVERLRAPARGRDAGLFVVRSPDGVTRVAIVKGLDTRTTLTPHRVTRIVDRLELGPDLLRVWPSTKRAPGFLDLRDSVGEYRTALQFAFELARDLYRASATTPIEDTTP